MNDGPDSLWRMLVKIWRWILSWLLSLIPRPSRMITFDTGRKVRMGRQIAEGGFSYVFEASDDAGRKYALKRIYLGDPETLAACRSEAGLHRSLRHQNLMPLLGMSLEERNTICYMLFPYVPHSLRAEVNRRFFSDGPANPWLEATALEIFLGILDGVAALHETNHTHRDLKLENVLLVDKKTPIIMDFGSAGPLVQSIKTRKQVLQLAEDAASHTTLPYRPPELLEGGVRAGDADVDFRKVDVWSLGCTLFAILYGASPFECEFARTSGIRIVDCTSLRILGDLPRMPEEIQQWYSSETMDLVKRMLTQDRIKRPDLHQVIQDTERLIEKQGGRVRRSSAIAGDDDNHMDVLLGNRGFV
jgi:serine/threonine kinase 16